MRRALGFALLLLSAALWASERIQDRAAQNEALRSFCGLLGQLYGLLESLTALGEQSFEALYRAALAQNPVARDKDARRALEALGAVLGRYELKTQLDAVSGCLAALRRELDKREGEARDAGRLTLGLSLSGAALLGIILL